jgi:CPA2 family monovalent cation:H+ antiporter-2
MSLGILIIQDLAIIPIMTLIPLVSQPFEGAMAYSVGWTLLKAILFLGASVLISFKLVPTLMDQLAKSHNREIFTLSTVSIGLGMAFVTGLLGLSHESGAFIAGLALSGSIYSRQLLADSRIFRDVFATLFFVTVGMFVNLPFVLENWLLILGMALAIAMVKGLAVFTSVSMFRFSKRTAFLTAFSLFQVGEFSFVLFPKLLEVSTDLPVWDAWLDQWYPPLFHAVILTMFVTPLMVRVAPKALKILLGFLGRDEHPDSEVEAKMAENKGHVVVAGYGVVGQQLIEILQAQNLPVTVVEMNPNTIKVLHKKGIRCVCGDVSRTEVLKSAGIMEAEVRALTFPDSRC